MGLAPTHAWPKWMEVGSGVCWIPDWAAGKQRGGHLFKNILCSLVWRGLGAGPLPVLWIRERQGLQGRHTVCCLGTAGPALPQPSCTRELAPSSAPVQRQGSQRRQTAPPASCARPALASCVASGESLSLGGPVIHGGPWPCPGCLPYCQPLPRSQFGLEMEPS